MLNERDFPIWEGLADSLFLKFREHCFITYPTIQQAGTSSSTELPQQYIRGFILVHHFSVLSCAFVTYTKEIRRGMRLSL